MSMKNYDSRDAVADQDTTGRTVVGMFTNRPDAEAAIRELKAAGFPDDRIGVALQDREEQGDLMETTTSGDAAAGAAKGAVSGSLVGGLIGLLGSLLVPGVGPIVVGGVLASTLTGAGIGAATGGIIGALVALGVPEADARHFDQGLRSGRTLVTVDAGAHTAEALVILDRHGMDFGPSGASRYQPGIEARGERARERGRYGGKDRRTLQDPTYAGPERRLVGV
jgi:heat induced stress protein YflT